MLVRLSAGAAVLTALTFWQFSFAQTPTTPPAPTAVPAAYTPTSLAAEPGLPRTPDGHPDFQGVVWATNFFPVFEASPMSADLVVSEEEAKGMVDAMVAGMSKSPGFKIDPEIHVIIGGTDGLPLVRGERRTRLIVLPADGKLPIRPDVKKATAGIDIFDGKKDDYEQRNSSERCLALGGPPPIHALVSYNRLRIVQTPTHVVIHHENGDQARIIPFANAHKPVRSGSWYGDAIARWDGDTLVIETVGQKASERIRGLMTKFVVEPDSNVVERFTRVSNDELLYQFTIEDADVYAAPWLGEFSFFTTDTGMFPFACHEHNHSLPNILQGARVADARAAGKPY
jgi:hypothetical protein